MGKRKTQSWFTQQSRAMRIFLIAVATISIVIAGSAVAATYYYEEIDRSQLLSYYNVEIIDGTYASPYGAVPYRLCRSKDLDDQYQYPSILFSPGLGIHLDRWTPDCIRLAGSGYMILMKDRVGNNYLEWEREVESGVDFLQQDDFVDAERISIMASSFGGQETQSYILTHPGETASYSAISTFNNPHVMRGSLEGFGVPTILLSGGGEQPPGKRDCDYDGFTWTTAFAEKLEAEDPDSFLGHQVFDQETYGCVYHGFMWDYGSPAEQEASGIILNFLDQKVGRAPRIIE